MKSFKVQVQNSKADFFRELLRNLDFVDFEEVDGFYESRVYPGANFELRTQSRPATTEKPVAGVPNVTKDADAMANIRKVLSNIDAQRDKHRTNQ
jgi:hypothetical protein